MHKTLIRFLTLILLSVLGITNMLAQDSGGTPAFAAVDAEGQIVVVDADGSITPVAASWRISSLGWSDDGSTLAYIAYNETFTSELWVIKPGLESPFKLEAGGLEGGFPVEFTPDGQILYVQPGDFNAETYQPHLMTIAPEPDAQPVELGTIDMLVGCGGGSPYPADGQYWGETGFGGQPVTLAWTDYGILHTTSCGGLGLALFDPATGEDRAIPTNAPEFDDGTPQGGYGNPVLSEDGQTLAVLYVQYTEDGPQRSLALIDLATGEVTDVATNAAPEQVAWGPANTLLYSSREQVKDLVTELSAEDKTNVEAFLGEGMPVPAYQSSITQLDLTTGEEQVLYEDYVYAIGRMIWADEELIFSTVANMDQWLARIAEGTLDPMDEQAVSELVPVSLYELVPGGTETLIGPFSLVELQ